MERGRCILVSLDLVNMWPLCNLEEQHKQTLSKDPGHNYDYDCYASDLMNQMAAKIREFGEFFKHCHSGAKSILSDDPYCPPVKEVGFYLAELVVDAEDARFLANDYEYDDACRVADKKLRCLNIFLEAANFQVRREVNSYMEYLQNTDPCDMYEEVNDIKLEEL